ncbi:MAG: hypothetical protein QHC90_03925 [Shinella sp.]|nr:hypothetical protein [Shinella sp.]
MRTVTGLFGTYGDARQAVTRLEETGIPSEYISIVSNTSKDESYSQDSMATEGAGTGAGLGAIAGGAGGLLTGLGLIAIPGVGPVVAAGWLTATAAGAAAGAVAGGAVGGLVGAMINSGVSEEDAHVYAEGIRRGGTMIVAKVDEGLVADAEAILQQANRVDTQARRTAYEDAGRRRFDETQGHYSEEEVEAERRGRHRQG